MKKFLKKIFFPHPVVYVLAILSGIGGMILLFPLGFLLGPISWVFFLICLYALIISVLGIFRMTRWLFRKIAPTAFGRFLKKLFGPEWAARLDLWTGVLINVGVAGFKLWLGAFYRSAWYFSVGIYYLALTGVWLYLINRDRMVKRRSPDPYTDGWKAFRTTGILLVPMDIAIAFMAARMIRYNSCTYYPPYVIYVLAIYAVYRVYISARRMFNKKISSPVLLALGGPGMSKALVSLFSLQAALLFHFGNSIADERRKLINTITGSIVMGAILLIAVMMIVNGCIALKRGPQVPDKKDEANGPKTDETDPDEALENEEADSGLLPE